MQTIEKAKWNKSARFVSKVRNRFYVQHALAGFGKLSFRR